MDTTQTMNWKLFKEAIQIHAELDLQFQYAPGKWVDASYHITEIKQAPITSVDCGGVMNQWTEIVVQLWEPSKKEQERAMKVRKALSIIDIVEAKLSLDATATVKIEFGNSQFDTRQMYPGQIRVDGDNLIVDLIPDFTQCKAINRGGSCGSNETGEECCTKEQEPKISLVNLVNPEASCAPDSGTC